MLGLGFGLALDALGVFLILSGSAAAGIAVLVISTFVVLVMPFSRRGGPGRRGSYSGGGGAGAGAGVVVNGDGGGFGAMALGAMAVEEGAVGKDGSSPLLAQASKRGGR